MYVNIEFSTLRHIHEYHINLWSSVFAYKVQELAVIKFGRIVKLINKVASGVLRHKACDDKHDVVLTLFQWLLKRVLSLFSRSEKHLRRTWKKPIYVFDNIYFSFRFRHFEVQN